MKLLRYGPLGQEKPGLLDKDNNIRDLSEYVKDIANDFLLPENHRQTRRFRSQRFTFN